MVNGSTSSVMLRDLDVLNRLGVTSSLTDGELLERFAMGRGPAAEASFTVLLDRHGPMVLHVCRQILGDLHQSEDAFQATFLILVRKAGSVRKRSSVASWLYGVARRVAKRVQAETIRRRTCERHAAKPEAAASPDPTPSMDRWADLYEEIGRLPARYREPVVLCYLEGQSTEAAAGRLGCPRGTVLSRLARARERLRKRLYRRNLMLAGAGLDTGMSPAVVPEALRSASITLSLQFLERPLSLAAGSSPAAALAQGVLHAMTVSQLKLVAVSLLACGLTVGGVHSLARPIRAAREVVPLEMAPPHADTPKAAQDDRLADLEARLKAAEVRNAALRDTLEAEKTKSKELLDRLFSVESQLVTTRIKEGTPKTVSPNPDPISKPAPSTSATPAQPQATGGSQQARRGSSAAARGREPFLRCNGLIFAASPSGHRVIAYNPQTHEEKAVTLNGEAQNKFAVTFREFDQGVALAIQGDRITRCAVYDYRKSSWVPLDLSEPWNGQVTPNRYEGNGALSYDVGQHLYTYDAGAGKWDDFNLGAISEEAGSQKASAPTAPGRQ